MTASTTTRRKTSLKLFFLKGFIAATAAIIVNVAAWECCHVNARTGFPMYVQSDTPAANGAFRCRFEAPLWICRRGK